MSTRAEQSSIRIPVATFLHGIIVMASAFGAYYVSNEISPIRVDIENIKEWKKEINKIAETCKLNQELFKQEHHAMTDLIDMHHETDLVTVQGLQAQINDLRGKK